MGLGGRTRLNLYEDQLHPSYLTGQSQVPTAVSRRIRSRGGAHCVPGTGQVLVNSEVREDFRGTLSRSTGPGRRPTHSSEASQRASSTRRVGDHGLQIELSKTWAEEGSRGNEEGQKPGSFPAHRPLAHTSLLHFSLALLMQGKDTNCLEPACSSVTLCGLHRGEAA